MTEPSRVLLDGLIAASLAAGREILDVYRRPIDVAWKADASPVTDADGRAERVILAALATLAPDIPVIAEESVAAGILPETGNRFFLVDPLDGTKEFISRNGEFTVNIALIEAGEPVLGVVYAPVIGRLWHGARAGGAFVRDVDGEGNIGSARPITVKCSADGDGLVVIGSRSHATPEADAYVASLRVESYRAAGSSLKFCLLAEGEADVYPRFGPTMEWDTAAGDAVLRAAGGSMITSAGDAFVYGKRGRPGLSDFANGFFIAAGGRTAPACGPAPTGPAGRGQGLRQ